MAAATKRELCFATALYSAITLLLAYPLSFNPGSTSMGSDADVHTFTWTLAWGAHALVHAPLSIFDANIFYPYDRTLAYSENLIGSAFIAAPVLWLTDNPVLALNVVSLVSCVLCGVGAYLLGRQIGLGPAAALVCGLIFAFSPARFFRFGQTHLTTIQWIPFALTWLHAYLDRGEKRDLRIALGFFTLQAITSGHGVVYLLIASGMLIAYRLLGGEPIAVIKRLRDVGLIGALLLVPVILLLPPYLRVQQEMGLVRTLENWAPAPESFLASPTHVHAWLIARLWDAPINERASAFLFPGYIPLLLAALALATLRSHPLRRDAIYFAGVTRGCRPSLDGPAARALAARLLDARTELHPDPVAVLPARRVGNRDAGGDWIPVADRSAPGEAPAASRDRGRHPVRRGVFVDSAAGHALSCRASGNRSLVGHPAQTVCGGRSAGRAVDSLPQHLHAAFDGALAEDRSRPQQPAAAVSRTAVRPAPQLPRRWRAAEPREDSASTTSSCTRTCTSPDNGPRSRSGWRATARGSPCSTSKAPDVCIA